MGVCDNSAERAVGQVDTMYRVQGTMRDNYYADEEPPRRTNLEAPRVTVNNRRMTGQNIIMDVKRGDEIVVYAYTGTWLADFPMNHYTHWVGLLLKPSQEEAEALRKEAMENY